MSRVKEADFVQVSMQDLSPIMMACLDEGKEVVLTVTGNSMAPFLRHQRDQVVLAKPTDPSMLQVGDVPLYRRQNGQFVLHRIVERDDGKKRCFYGEKSVLPSMHSSSGLTYTMLGDAQVEREPDIRPEQIMAISVAFVRKGKRWECRSTAYRRRCLRWHKLMPLRRPIIWCWHRWHGVKRRINRLLQR